MVSIDLKCNRSVGYMAAIAVMVVGVAGTEADAAVISVSADTIIFAAGQSSVPDLQGGGGSLPAAISLSADGRQLVTFPSITGEVLCCSDLGSNGPDGRTDIGTNISSLGSISGIRQDNAGLFLTGVFIGDGAPTGLPPAQRDFTGETSLASFRPLLNQVFFIGDGLTGTGSGEIQQFFAPEGATRLFLGFADADAFQGEPAFYADNSGSLSVEVEIASVSGPATLGIIGIGLASIGWIRRFYLSEPSMA